MLPRISPLVSPLVQIWTHENFHWGIPPEQEIDVCGAVLALLAACICIGNAGRPVACTVAAQRFLGIAMARAKCQCTLQWLSSSGPSCSTKMCGQSGSTLTRCWSRPWRSQLRKQTHMSLRHIGQHIHTQTAQRRLADSHGCVCWDGWRRGQRHLIDGGRGGGAAWPRRQRGSVGMQIPGNWQVGDPGGVAVLGWGMTENGGQSDVLRCRPLPLSGAAFWLCLQVDGKLASSAGVVR